MKCLSAVSDGKDLVTKEYVAGLLNGNASAGTVSSQVAPSSITIADNTEYYLTAVTSLTFTYPNGNFECWIRLSTASSGTISIAFPATSSFIGQEPVFDNSETWEVSIKDGVVIAVKVTA